MRLIDADALKKLSHEEWDGVLVWDESGETTADEFCNLVDCIPTADVVDKERYDRLLENANILADAVRKYQTADVVEVVRCKDCKHFEYDHPYMIQGVPIMGHLVCNRWGDGCKTSEDGYCFMAERKETEDEQS